MFNLSFWRNSKAKKKNSSSKANLSVISVIFVVVSWRRSHFQQQQFLISSFISRSMPHFFSKMSLSHRWSLTPCLWVVIDVLFLLSSISSEVLGWTSHCHQDPWKQVNTAAVVHLFIVLFIILFTCEQHHKAIFLFLHLSFPLIMLLVPLFVVATAILFPGRAAAETLKYSFHNITTTFFKEVQFFMCKRKEGLSGFEVTVYPMNQQRESVGGWLSMKSPVMPTESTSFKKLIHLFHCFCLDEFHLSVHYFYWIEATW